MINGKINLTKLNKALKSKPNNYIDVEAVLDIAGCENKGRNISDGLKIVFAVSWPSLCLPFIRMIKAANRCQVQP